MTSWFLSEEFIASSATQPSAISLQNLSPLSHFHLPGCPLDWRLLPRLSSPYLFAGASLQAMTLPEFRLLSVRLCSEGGCCESENQWQASLAPRVVKIPKKTTCNSSGVRPSVYHSLDRMETQRLLERQVLGIVKCWFSLEAAAH